LTITAWLQGIP